MKQINKLILAVVFSFVVIAPLSAMPFVHISIDENDYFDDEEVVIKTDTIEFRDILGIIFNDLNPRIDISVSHRDHTGISILKNSKESFNFFVPHTAELKAGYVKERRSILRSIVKTNYSYFTFRYIGRHNALSDELYLPNYVNFHGKQMGFGNETAMGWKICSAFDILLTNADNYHWTHTKFVQEADYEFGDKRDRYHDKISYGTSFESGITLNLFNSLGVNATYEQNHFLPAYMTWYYLGSTMIESLSKLFTRNFVNSIARRSTVAGPLINFIVQSGISYGMYELRKSKMNWPFSNEPPLVMERIKFGLSYSFK